MQLEDCAIHEFCKVLSRRTSQYNNVDLHINNRNTTQMRHANYRLQLYAKNDSLQTLESLRLLKYHLGAKRLFLFARKSPRHFS